MTRNRESIGHAAVVGFLPKEMLQPLHHSHRVNRNCLNLALFYLTHAFGFNTFSATRMCSDRQRVGLRPLQRCRLVALFGPRANSELSPQCTPKQTSDDTVSLASN